MIQPEEKYFSRIQTKIELFGSIQHEFVYQKTGVVALVKLIRSMGGSPSELSLRDPVMQKGKSAALKVIGELECQLGELREIEPPAVWSNFHSMLLSSLELQLEGYREMLKVFEDSEIRHIGRGKDIVKKGMSILEGGIPLI